MEDDSEIFQKIIDETFATVRVIRGRSTMACNPITGECVYVPNASLFDAYVPIKYRLKPEAPPKLQVSQEKKKKNQPQYRQFLPKSKQRW